MKKRPVWLLATFLLLATIISACSDDNSDSSNSPSSESAAVEDGQEIINEPTSQGEPTTDINPVAAGLARAQQVVDRYSMAPNQITVTEQVSSLPESGKTVAWIACEITCATFNPVFQEATDALDWDLEILSVATVDNKTAILQALDIGADFIAITGTPPATFIEEITIAQERGVGIFMCFDTTIPDPANNNIYTNCAGEVSAYAAGKIHANKIIVESEGNANVLMINIPDFDILVSQREGAKAAYAENCPNCTFQELAVTLDQLLTAGVPDVIVSTLLIDDSINWVHIATSGMAYGILDALDKAGLSERVKVSGVGSDAVGLADMVTGRYEFLTVNPVLYSAWLMVDGMVRTSVGDTIPGGGHVNPPLPTYIVDTAEEAQRLLDTPEQDFKGPATMEDQFKALWGIG
tara:strand:- start:6909 stop:8132 length:1224 start_codon:yes stop_codon:yes gene_type:complete